MRRELKNIAEYKKARNEAFASVVRSFGEANSRFHALAVESVGRAVEIQSQIVGQAYETYISEISKLGKMFFVGFSTFTARSRELPHANLNERKATDRQQAASAEAKVNPNAAGRRTAAQSLSPKRKTVTESGSERSAKARRKAGSVRRTKG